jgi:Ribbon-helix-helix domain
MDEPVRWTVRVSKDTDVAVRKFIEEAVRWRVFDETLRETRSRNAHVAPEEIDRAIEEALAAVRAEHFGPRP